MKWTPNSKLIIQGITEPIAAYYAQRMKASGTAIVAGISAGQGGQSLGEIPLFDLVETAVADCGEIETSLIFVPPYQVLDAALEAMAAKIRQLIILTSHVPPLDMAKLLEKAQENNTFVLGSGSQGIIIPQQLWLGTGEFPWYQAGKVGIISRGDRLMDEVAWELTQAGIGQSLAVSLGTDRVIGSNFEQWLEILEEEEQTELIVMIGYPHSHVERSAAHYVASTIEKPVILYLFGVSAPLEPQLGDADTLITSRLSPIASSADSSEVAAMFKAAGVTLASKISEIPSLIQKKLKPSLKRPHRSHS